MVRFILILFALSLALAGECRAQTKGRVITPDLPPVPASEVRKLENDLEQSRKEAKFWKAMAILFKFIK